MKAFEWALLVVNVALILVGRWFFEHSDMPALGIACWITAGLVFIGYIVVCKVLPLAHAQQAFLDAASRNHFAPLTDQQSKAEVVRALRTFPGFNDMHVSVSDLHGLENSGGLFFAGGYAVSGEGLNWGYFLLAVLRPRASLESLALNKSRDHTRGFSAAEEFALSGLPRRVSEALRDFPYDFHFRDNRFLADFDARHLRETDFAAAFDSICGAMIALDVR